MNCENLQSNLPLYIDDVLSEGERVSIEKHLPTCPLCRQKLSEYKNLRNELRMVSRPAVPSELLSSVRSAVNAEINRPTITTGTEVEPTFTEKLAHWILPYSVGTVAASIFTFVMLTALITTKDTSRDILAQNQKPERSSVMVANTNPEKVREKLSLPPEYEQISVRGYPPEVNPAGALVALTKSIVRGKMSEEEVVVVADVFNDGLAQINEVIEPPTDDEAMNELQKAFKTDPEKAPFLPAKTKLRTNSVRVILKINRVDVVN